MVGNYLQFRVWKQNESDQNKLEGTHYSSTSNITAQSFALVLSLTRQGQIKGTVGIRNWLYSRWKTTSVLSGDFTHRQQGPTHLLSLQSPYIPSVHLVYLPPLPMGGCVTAQTEGRPFLIFIPSSFFFVPFVTHSPKINLSHMELH